MQANARATHFIVIKGGIALDHLYSRDGDMLSKPFIIGSSRFDMRRFVVIFTDLNLQVVWRLDADINVFGKPMDNAEAFRE